MLVCPFKNWAANSSDSASTLSVSICSICIKAGFEWCSVKLRCFASRPLYLRQSVRPKQNKTNTKLTFLSTFPTHPTCFEARAAKHPIRVFSPNSFLLGGPVFSPSTTETTSAFSYIRVSCLISQLSQPLEKRNIFHHQIQLAFVVQQSLQFVRSFEFKLRKGSRKRRRLLKLRFFHKNKGTLAPRILRASSQPVVTLLYQLQTRRLDCSLEKHLFNTVSSNSFPTHHLTETLSHFHTVGKKVNQTNGKETGRTWGGGGYEWFCCDAIDGERGTWRTVRKIRKTNTTTKTCACSRNRRCNDGRNHLVQHFAQIVLHVPTRQTCSRFQIHSWGILLFLHLHAPSVANIRSDRDEDWKMEEDIAQSEAGTGTVRAAWCWCESPFCQEMRQQSQKACPAWSEGRTRRRSDDLRVFFFCNCIPPP